MTLFAVALTYPAVIYTVLLGMALVYWLFVVMGAVHLDMSGADGALDGTLDGAADGAVEGAVKGALEGAVKGASEGLADGGAGGHAAGGHDVDVPGGSEEGVLAPLLGALKLRSVPVTVTFSFFVTYGWLVTVLGVDQFSRWLPDLSPVLRGSLVFLASPLLALPLVALSIRPLAPLFRQRKAKSNKDLVGQVCVVRTGSVDKTFGEATLEDGGAGLVVRVRVDAGETFARGDEALIVGWDAEEQAFLIAPLDEELRTRRAP